jgi:4'-phosphopantetheinyl transferase
MNAHVVIEPQEVHLWQIWIPDFISQEAELIALLSPDELERAYRFRFPQHKQRFIIARASLRNILSQYLPIPPHKIEFAYGNRGKPFLKANPQHLEFNLTHSDEMAICAITKNASIGIDIQKIEEKYNPGIAKRFFSTAENQDLEKLPAAERNAAFCSLWSCKEALIKAVGEGLYVPLGDFSVSLEKDEQWVRLKHNTHEENYFLKKIDIHASFKCALAIDQEIKALLIHHWR